MTPDLFDPDMTSADVRRNLAQRHPMLDQGYIIVTPEIKAFHDVVFDWAVARKSGLFTAGLHEQGKSKALEYTINLLKTEGTASFPDIPDNAPSRGRRNFSKGKDDE